MNNLKGKNIYLFLAIIKIIICWIFGNNIIYANTDILQVIRPIAVMIGNSPQERKIKQGVDQADIVYEIEVEYPFTRLMAIYLEDKDTVVGPIRSSRYYFSRIAIEWSAIFVHCGGQSFKNDQVIDIDEITYHSPFWRDDNIGGWINLFTDIQKIKKEVKKDHYIRTNEHNNEHIHHSLINFQAFLFENKKQINKISIKYNENYVINYRFNPEDNNYFRYINNDSYNISVKKENIKVSNIIVQYVPIRKIEGDQYGRVKVELIGEGEGAYFHSGFYQPIKWSKKSKNDQTFFSDREGSPIILNNGPT